MTTTGPGEMVYAEILFNVKDELEEAVGSGARFAEEYDDQYCALVRKGFLAWLEKHHPGIFQGKNWDWQTDYRGAPTVNLFRETGEHGADLSHPEVAEEILSAVNKQAEKWRLEDDSCHTCGGHGGGSDPETRCHSCRGRGVASGRGRPEPGCSWEDYQWQD